MTVFDKAKEKKSDAAGGRKNAPLLAPSARGLRPQAVGERTVRRAGIFRVKAGEKPDRIIAALRMVCRGRIYASRAGYPLYRMIGTAAAGGIYAAPTSQPILFILVYGRGRGVPRPYTCNRGKTHPHSSPLRISLSTPPLPILHDTTKKEPVTFCMSQARGARYRTRTCDLLHVKQMLYQLS